MAAANLLIKPMSFGQYVAAQNDLVTDNTKSDTGVFKRFILAAELHMTLQGSVVPRGKLKEMLAEVNMRAYPKQDAKSHTMWAGKAISSMVKMGFAEEIAVDNTGA
jgi:hypothetical protein